jgi:hypothetical protein
MERVSNFIFTSHGPSYVTCLTACNRRRSNSFQSICVSARRFTETIIAIFFYTVKVFVITRILISLVP